MTVILQDTFIGTPGATIGGHAPNAQTGSQSWQSPLVLSSPVSIVFDPAGGAVADIADPAYGANNAFAKIEGLFADAQGGWNVTMRIKTPLLTGANALIKTLVYFDCFNLDGSFWAGIYTTVYGAGFGPASEFYLRVPVVGFIGPFAWPGAAGLTEYDLTMVYNQNLGTVEFFVNGVPFYSGFSGIVLAPSQIFEVDIRHETAGSPTTVSNTIRSLIVNSAYLPPTILVPTISSQSALANFSRLFDPFGILPRRN